MTTKNIFAERDRTGKQEVSDAYVSRAWGRTVVFLKLTRHKIENGNLPGDWEEYKLALIEEFRQTEYRINEWKGVDNRGGDRKTANYREHLKQNAVCWSQREHDEKMREIIKRIQEKYNA